MQQQQQQSLFSRTWLPVPAVPCSAHGGRSQRVRGKEFDQIALVDRDQLRMRVSDVSGRPALPQEDRVPEATLDGEGGLWDLLLAVAPFALVEEHLVGGRWVVGGTQGDGARARRSATVTLGARGER